MMQKNIHRTCVLLAGALASTLAIPAQQASHVTETNVAVLFNLEHAQLAQTGTPGFWIKGAAVDASTTFWKGLGVAVNLTGEHTSNIAPNISLGKIAFMAGPRYTLQLSKYTGRTKNHRTEFFGEWLFGGAHAFDSTFPGTNGVQTTASSFSMQMGGGADIAVAGGFGVRALEIDWVHTSLANNAANAQNDLRVGFGMSWRR